MSVWKQSNCCAKLLRGPVWPFYAIFFKFYSLDSGHVNKIVNDLEQRGPGWSSVWWWPSCPPVTLDTGQGPANCRPQSPQNSIGPAKGGRVSTVTLQPSLGPGTVKAPVPALFPVPCLVWHFKLCCLVRGTCRKKLVTCCQKPVQWALLPKTFSPFPGPRP